MLWMPVLGWIMGLVLILALFPIAIASGVMALIFKKMATMKAEVTKPAMMKRQRTALKGV